VAVSRDTSGSVHSEKQSREALMYKPCPGTWDTVMDKFHRIPSLGAQRREDSVPEQVPVQYHTMHTPRYKRARNAEMVLRREDKHCRGCGVESCEK
jgi:hypothetical protein